jgi:meso-butanediol dehydrogenase / (S,S)-butanediol dehydrogenase / diacetyl reductase
MRSTLAVWPRAWDFRGSCKERNVGKTIVITGAAIGLGRAMARRFAADGDTVVLLGRTLEKVQAVVDELGAPAMAVHCDVSDPDSVRAAFSQVAAVHPKIDVIINNAGVYEPFLITEATDEQIMAPLMTNLAGTLFCCRAAIPMMGNGGRIINVSSESVETIIPMMSVYRSSKAGIEFYSQSLGVELEEQGINVTLFRAGPMWEEGKGAPWSPEVSQRFGAACAAKGINMRERGISHVNSVAQLMRAVVDTPADIKLKHVAVEGRKA